MSLRPSRRPSKKPFAYGTALSLLLLSSLALAADQQQTPAQLRDSAGQAMSQALVDIGKAWDLEKDKETEPAKRLERSRNLLVRARSELMQAQDKAPAAP